MYRPSDGTTMTPGTGPRIPARTEARVTLVSPNTGRTYRFEHKGARVEIDLRDRPWLASQPNLRQLPNS